MALVSASSCAEAGSATGAEVKVAMVGFDAGGSGMEAEGCPVSGAADQNVPH
jgi:hypothetical protein